MLITLERITDNPGRAKRLAKQQAHIDALEAALKGDTHE